MGVPCRCLTRIDGKKCTQRKTLKKNPRAYKEQPECPKCGGRNWYVETYRINTEYGKICNCSAYNFPHLRFTGRCSRQYFAEEYWNLWFGRGSCEGCISLNETEDIPYCEVVAGQESAKTCAAVQEFELENG